MHRYRDHKRDQVAGAVAAGAGLKARGAQLKSINSCCLATSGDRVFTVDYAGYVRVWALHKNLLALTEAEVDVMEWDAFRAANATASGPCQLATCIKLVAHGDLVGDVLACVRYSPFGGERVAVMCRDNACYLFNGFTMNLRYKLAGATCENRNLPVMFSPDGQYVAAGSEDGKVYFWNCSSGVVDAVVDLHIDTPIGAVAWHPTQVFVPTPGCSYFFFPAILFFLT